MRFNKTKALRAAEKSLSQGKIQAAITEYRRIVEQDANDWTALNMLGDLYVRTGQPAEANKLFARVAEHYRSQGFALKAIAMYKKMLRLRPDDLTASGTLAELYAAQGLVVEARAQLLSIADSYTQLNRTHDALDTLRRIADLDPHNPEVRLRVATAYARESFADEAADAYAEAGDRFLQRQTPEPALDAYAEALKLAPTHAAALAGTLAAHIHLGTPDEAAELFEAACVRNPYDAALLELLLRAYVEAENAESAEGTVGRLVTLRKNESAARAAYVDVARLHLKTGDAEATVRVLADALEPALTAGRDAELLDLLEEVTTRNPEHLAALHLLTRVYSWQHDEALLIQTLERVAEAASLAGSREEEVHALLRLFETVPDNADYRERLRALDALPAGANPVFAQTRDLADADEVPTFESFMFADAAAQVDSASASSAMLEDSGFDIINSLSTETDNADADSANAHAAPLVQDPSASFADLSDDFADDAKNAAATENSVYAETSEYQEIEWGAPLTTSEVAAASLSADDERIMALLNQELESVDFYITQGYTDVAGDTLDMLERQYGAHAMIEERRRLLNAEGAASEANNEAVFATESIATENAAETFIAETSVTETLAGEVGTADESVGANIAFASDEQAATFGDISFAAESFEQTPSAVVEQSPEFSLDSTFVAPPIENRESPVAAAHDLAASPAEAAGDFDAGLSAIFDEFRAAVEDETPTTTADYETHYNLGIAYQEMGLTDEAVEEFQKAAGIAAPNDGTPRYLQCCNMLGHCFMQKGLAQLAVMWFRKGLDTPGHTEDEYQALRYELGAAYEAAGERDRALTTFMEVYGIDVSYRGVSDKLRELRMGAELVG